MPSDPPDRKARTRALRRELEATVLPRQFRALEAVAARLDEERPVPTAEFHSHLEQRIMERRLSDGGHAPGFRLRVAAYIGSGLVLLLIGAIAAALGS